MGSEDALWNHIPWRRQCSKVEPGVRIVPSAQSMEQGRGQPKHQRAPGGQAPIPVSWQPADEALCWQRTRRPIGTSVALVPLTSWRTVWLLSLKVAVVTQDSKLAESTPRLLGICGLCIVSWPLPGPRMASSQVLLTSKPFALQTTLQCLFPRDVLFQWLLAICY